jgi:hypothetical protein
MLDHPFNQSRSYTKFFDITRAGAVGVYAKPGPWQHLIDHEKNGLLCPMESQAWVDAILALAANAPEVRQALVQNAQEKITFLSNPRVL